MATLRSVPDSMSDLLASYAQIPKEQQLQHIVEVRDAAYKAHEYLCLARFRFLELDLEQHYLYHSVLVPWLSEKVSENETQPLLLDLGACLGQDLRKLIHDGVPASRLYGADIVPAFIETGYELFKDRDKLPNDHFITPADIFDTSPDNKLSVMDGKLDVLHVTAVFHLFGLTKQKLVAERCLRLLRRDGPTKRSLMLGAQVGNVEPEMKAWKDEHDMFRHNKASWQEMWEGIISNDEWKDKIKSIEVEADLRERFGVPGMLEETPETRLPRDPNFRWMVWSVWVGFN